MNHGQRIRALLAVGRIDEANDLHRSVACDLSPLRPEEATAEPSVCACGRCASCRVALAARGVVDRWT